MEKRPFSQQWDRDPSLAHIFARAIGIARFADVIGQKEDDLGKPFVRVDLCWKWRCVGYFQSHMAFPFRFERRDVDDDPAAGVRRFSNADREDLAGDPEIFDATGQRKRVGRHDANIGLDIHERPVIKRLGIDHSVENIGKNLELVGDAEVVAVARKPVANHAAAVVALLDLAVNKRIDHPVFFRHAANPFIGANRHKIRSGQVF